MSITGKESEEQSDNVTIASKVIDCPNEKGRNSIFSTIQYEENKHSNLDSNSIF